MRDRVHRMCECKNYVCTCIIIMLSTSATDSQTDNVIIKVQAFCSYILDNE